MGFSLRSLLLAAIVISNCITWTASRHSYTHNVSGHRRRHRRQGGKQFLPDSYVIPGGEGSEKGWGTWGPESPCSRTCGGGVASQKRICLTLGSGANCTGGDTKYFSCNTDPCPDSSLDYRAEQCASFNSKPFNGKKYDWVPYTNGPRPCELNCMPKGERFYYRHAIKVVDGTLCNDESFDVCVNGECQPVGCDFMLGSHAREDKCRKCRGNGTNCHTNAGLIDDPDLPQGYNDILLIPEGATNIVIEEIDKSNNYLALRSKQDNKYYLNGNYQISFPHTMQIAGTLWHYIRDVQGFAAPDKLRCLGPIEEPLYLSLLLQETNVGVKYEYSIPEDKAPHPETQYTWAHDEFSPCSVSCGTGFKTRNVTCRDKDKLNIAEDRMCEAGLRPIANETCQLAECLPEWVPSPWGPCSKLCGTGGSQARQVQCQKIISNGYPSIVDENQCFRRLGDKPEEHQKCNVNATCPTWFTGPWKPCDKLCGDGKQSRQVVCHRKTNGRVEVLVDSSCEDEKPETEQPCNIHPCDGIDWVISNWTGCDSCFSKFYTREAKCVTKDRQVVEPELCSYHRKPELQKPCDKASLPSCESQWYATQWSNCSVDCGKGEKTRKVFCGLFDGGAVQEVDESKCDADAKYNDTTPCEVSADECPAIWFAANWTECTKECDGGQQFRKVMCLTGGNSSTSCPEGEMPDEEQSCNDKPCNIDELISVSSTTVMDDDDLPDCEDEDEVGAELFSSTSLSDMMFSDASSTTLEGSGASETGFDFSSFFTVTGTDTTDTGSGDTDLTTDSSTTGSRQTSESTVTGKTMESSVADTGSTTTDSTGTGSTDSTVSSRKDSESTDSTVSGEPTVTGPTDASSKDASTGKGGSPGSTTTGGSKIAGKTKAPGLADTSPTTPSDASTGKGGSPGSTTTGGSKIAGKTKAPGLADTSPTTPSYSTGTGSTDSTVSSRTDSESTDSTVSGEPTVTGPTDASSKDASTGKGGSPGLTTTGGFKIAGKTKAPGLADTSPTTPRDSTGTGSTDSTVSSRTDSESTDSTVSGEPTVTGPTDASSKDASTGKGGSPGSTTTGGSKIAGKTKAPGLADTSPTTPSDSTGTGSTDSTVSSRTDSESTDSTVSGEPTVTGPTDASSKDASTGKGGSPGSTTTGGSKIAGKTKAPGLADTSPTTPSDSTGTGSTDSTVSSRTDSESTDSTVSGEPTVTGPTDASSKDASTGKGGSPGSTTTGGSKIAGKTKAPGLADTSPTTPSDASTGKGGSPGSTTTGGSKIAGKTKAPGLADTSPTTPSYASTGKGGSPGSTTTGGSKIAGKTKAPGLADTSPTTPSDSTGTGSTDSTVSSRTDSESTDSTVSGEPTVTGPTDASSKDASTGKGGSPGSTTTGGSKIAGKTKAPGLADTSPTTPSDASTGKGGSPGSTTTGGSKIAGKTKAPGLADSSPTTPSDGSTSTTESGTGSTETTVEGTGSTTSGSTSSYDETTGSDETTGWDLSTILSTTKRCRPRNKPAKCVTSKFGCCPDKNTPAGGPFDEGCPSPTTCKDTKYGCCPDGVSPAGGPHNRDCPVPDCKETLYGCCKSDRKTPAEGNDQEGCPPKCKFSKFGCCADNETQATGPHKAGCPETSTTELSTEATTESGATDSTEFATTEATTEAVTETCEIINGTKKCHPCSITKFGCCDDGDTAAHGPNKLGCCLISAHGCCPDNLHPASGPDGEGCDCKNSTFGCCPDGKSYATGANNSGCGCEHTPHGCCPDRHTEANGPNFKGCSCHTFQFGCCPDGTTTAEGPNQQGCRCERSTHGCCGDGVTAATGPNQKGCDCASSKYGCCLDGVTEAQSKNFSGCAEAPINKQAACRLAYEQGPCTNYSKQYFYDTDYGGCSRFHYGGCGGNGNRFAEKAECEDVCVHPAGKDACRLPAVKGSCTNNLSVRWYWDDSYQACMQFHYGGCLGNANNYLSLEECEKKCSPRLNPEDTCTLTLEKGPCAGNFSRWGYNEETGRCEKFLWGGCEGNNNRFPSEAACKLKCDPPGKQQPACEQPQDAGNCTEMLPYWSFSKKEQRCVPFYYGGCGGNDNKFRDQKSCDDACPKAYEKDKCTLPADTGDCRTNFTLRWFFDTKHQQCRQFPYGGCGGNANNFLLEEICNSECNRRVPRPPAPQDICTLPPAVGTCREPHLRYYFDPHAGRCAPFTYGGCEGNQNNFVNEQECQKRCAPVAVSPPVHIQVPAKCHVASISQCVGVGRVWYLEPRSGRCTPYDPRPGASRCQLPGVFSSPEACERACGDFREIGDVCRMEKDPGPCSERQPKYYFDSTTRSCESFAYGGCFGSPNRFSTPEECESVCLGESLDPCKLPPSAGNCTERIESWFYDEERDDCGEFYYTGCSGNDNRFASRDECLGRCKTGAEPPSENQQCLTPTSLEACGDDAPGFYYDHIQGRCLRAPIGGCTENPNNYRTEEECERTCGSFKGQDVCRAPLDPGPCRADHPKFYWNLREGRCEAYTYGGCNGGPNRFSNQEECEEVCGHLTIDPACGQAPAPGVPCAGAGGGGGTARWHRSPLYGDCRLFIYYGCGGNGNNFGSKEACERHCSPPSAGYDPSENEVVECAAQAAACQRLRCEFGTTRRKDAYGCESCSCDPNPCADIVCPPGTRCDLVPDRDLTTGEPKYTSQCRPDYKHPVPADCSAEKARCASLDCELSMQTTRGPDGCERCECVRPEPNCQPFVDECNALKCNYGPITRTTDADGCERCTCIAHPCEGKRCLEGQRCVVSASRDAITGETQYSGDCGTVDKPGTCPAEQGSAGSCHVVCNDDADCRGVQKCCRSGCSQLCRAPAAPENNVQQPLAPRAPEPNPETEREVTSSVGGIATLRCLFHSNPPPQITWKKGEITIDGTQGRYRLTSDGALQIVSLYRDDSGVYICVGQNELGSSQQEIVLNVAGPVEAPAGIVGETESVVIGVVGHALRVRCLAYGYPEPTIAWYHRPTGTMVPYDSAKYELRKSDMLIKSLDIETLGNYTCQAYNGLGKAVSWTVTVRAERPAGSSADSPYLLQRGAPAPPRTERPELPRPGSASYFKIPPAPPQFTVPVRTTLRAQQTALATGGILELSCEVDGHPEPRVYWTKDNAQLADSDRIYITPARLSVSRLVEEDAGVYGCHADNGHSSHHSVVQISVQKLHIPDLCKDNQYFADCKLIVRSKLCRHEYYSKFCCRSCVEAGALDAQTLEFQGDDAFTYKKK